MMKYRGPSPLILLTVTTVLAMIAFGCKASHWKKSNKEADRQAAGTVAGPQRVQSADAVSSAVQSFEIDSKSGRPKQQIVLRLDYFPKNESGGTNLPACYGAFPSTFELGIFFCQGQQDHAQPLLVGHVAQDCYTNPRFERVPASSPMQLAGCTQGALVLHQFDPALRVDFEQR